MTKEIHTLADVDLDDVSLLQKGYSPKELIGKELIITNILKKEGDMGEYLIISFKGEKRPLSTGATNIVAKLKAADEQGLFPLKVAIIQIGNAFDIK